QEEKGQQSLECIQANQIFPKKSPVLEEENMQVPFPELHGEFAEYVGRAEDAIIAVSNYRLHIKFKESVVNVPLQLVETVECRDMFQLHVTCKDCKVVRCQFSTFEQCQEWLKRLNTVVRPPSRLENLFSFAFHAWCMDVYAGEKEQHGELCRPGEHVTSWFKNEVERMGFDTQNAWRISDINSKLCPSYPQQLLVPAWITDKELENVAAFRSWKRFPSVVYRHQTTGAVIARCGQPEVSWWGWRNADDEHLVQSIAKACAVDGSSRKHISNGGYTNGNDLPDTDFESSMTNSSEVETLATQPHKLLILDARSYAAAVANRAKGGGCECPEYYPNCEVVFMGMANIHSIRKSFQSLRFLCTQMPDPANWLSALESTKWLQHLSLLLKAALLVVNAVDRDHRPVLVHCSDGWDRTPQIVALSKVLLDPYYRTIEGFQVLLETDWLDFGHKFADRCGHGENSEDVNERCPVFLQWLDCVHQLQRQFPCSFEFNEAFLVLHPVCHVRNLMLWTAVYLPSSSPTTPSDESCAPYPVPGGNPEDARTKTRSFDNLPSACELGSSLAPNRRSSDPSLNEKWQDHRRSLELNMAVGPEGGGNPDQEVRPNGVGLYPDGVDSELEDSLQPRGSHSELRQEASVCTAATGDEAKEAELSVAVGVAESQMENILQEATKEEAGADVQREGSAAVKHVTDTVDTESEEVAKVEEDDRCAEVNGTEMQREALANGHHPVNGVMEAEENDAPPSLPTQMAEELDHQAAEVTQAPEELEKQDVENSSVQEELAHGPRLEAGEHGFIRTLNGGCKRPSVSAFQCVSADLSRDGFYNGDSSDAEPCGGHHWVKGNGERVPLSRQVSLASCNSLILHPRGSCSQHRWCHALLGRAAISPEQPSRSHLDDDGLTLHTDAIQQRLRQIEAGHQLEVETLKKQVQELWSRLENQQHAGSQRFNGDMGDELFSEASWEQVDKQDTEVTRWYPDHLAAQCYGCESRFWLAARKHHCRNCGNVFCASCCDQKIPVPSQQLFDPSRVCKSCYGSLKLSPAPLDLDLELEKPITASSN
uniref:phosphatidylinositol-3,5-bisphosphate 3-phosphatase n=1 Tax=Cyclopterus lumpus TaxID=8103 RepID=A0A8C2XKY5_CYCLU